VVLRPQHPIEVGVAEAESPEQFARRTKENMLRNPVAWKAGLQLAKTYYESRYLATSRGVDLGPETFPTTPDQVQAKVQFALNERLPGVIDQMLKAGSFKELGIEPTNEVLSIMAIAFSIGLEKILTGHVSLSKDVPIPKYEPPSRLFSVYLGCGFLIGWVFLVEWGWKRVFPKDPCPDWLQFVLCLVGVGVFIGLLQLCLGWWGKVSNRAFKAKLDAANEKFKAEMDAKRASGGS
jgi:hypothetical protein